LYNLIDAVRASKNDPTNSNNLVRNVLESQHSMRDHEVEIQDAAGRLSSFLQKSVTMIDSLLKEQFPVKPSEERGISSKNVLFCTVFA
jgi:hypothetical protein